MLKKLKKFVAVAITVLITATTAFAWPVGYNSVGVLYTSEGGGSCVRTTQGVYSAKHIIGKGDVHHNFKVVKVHKTLDLMIIKLTDKQKLRTVQIAKHIDPDKPVYCVGWFAGGRQKVCVPGHIIGRLSERYAQRIDTQGNYRTDHIMVDLEIVPGMSGGGCFQDGKLIGIISASMVLCGQHRCDGQLFSIMVPIPGIQWIGDTPSARAIG
jgi:hypothetical protein